jgi:hypothetical protein
MAERQALLPTPCSDPTVPSVHELAKALVEHDAQARSSNVHFDEYVQVELPQHFGNILIDIELLGQACEIAKGRVGAQRNTRVRFLWFNPLTSAMHHEHLLSFGSSRLYFEVC